MTASEEALSCEVGMPHSSIMEKKMTKPAEDQAEL